MFVGAGRVLLLGTDAPTLPPGLLELTLASVQTGADAACIPALDGGYIAPLPSPACCPRCWTGCPGARQVLLEATRARAAERGLRFDELQAWHDVDEAEDLRHCGDAGRRPPAGLLALPPYRASQTREALQG